MTSKQAGDVLGVSAQTVVRWAKVGRLRASYTEGGHVRVCRDEVERMAAIHAPSLDEAVDLIARGLALLRVEKDKAPADGRPVRGPRSGVNPPGKVAHRSGFKYRVREFFPVAPPELLPLLAHQLSIRVNQHIDPTPEQLAVTLQLAKGDYEKGVKA